MTTKLAIYIARPEEDEDDEELEGFTIASDNVDGSSDKERQEILAKEVYAYIISKYREVSYF